MRAKQSSGSRATNAANGSQASSTCAIHRARSARGAATGGVRRAQRPTYSTVRAQSRLVPGDPQVRGVPVRPQVVRRVHHLPGCVRYHVLEVPEDHPLRVNSRRATVRNRNRLYRVTQVWASPAGQSV